MRKNYLDNIRIIIILLLFTYHTFMIWNNYGEKFYIWAGDSNCLSTLIVLVASWFMPILFLIAGISARYSLQKRNTKEFIKERIKKILIPFIFGLIFLVPLQTLYARIYFNNYNGNIIENFQYFFTHYSDLTGYDGMFTLGHLWFLLYLFLITIITLPVIKKIKLNIKPNIFIILFMFIPLYIMYNIGNIGGKSIGEYIFLYLIGYYLVTDEFIDKLIKLKKIILPIFLLSEIIIGTLYYTNGFYNDLLVKFVGWFGICSCIIIGKLFFNKENKITKYFKNASFPIYILHQTILVIVGYYSLTYINNFYIQLITILLISFTFTIMFYEIIKRIPIIRKMIGIK